MNWCACTGWGRVLVATIIMTLPIFFAALLFADAYARSPAPDLALGWNALGAVVGGLSESAAFLAGIPALVALAALFYLLALKPLLLDRSSARA